MAIGTYQVIGDTDLGDISLPRSRVAQYPKDFGFWTFWIPFQEFVLVDDPLTGAGGAVSLSAFHPGESARFERFEKFSLVRI